MLDYKNKKILIAEDEKSYSNALVLKLQHAGFEVESVQNGEDAIEALRKCNFDLFLCDIIMPKMNGFQVIEEMERQGLKIPVICLSNLGQEEDEKKIREAGVVDFLSKANTPIINVIKKIENFFNKK